MWGGSGTLKIVIYLAPSIVDQKKKKNLAPSIDLLHSIQNIVYDFAVLYGIALKAVFNLQFGTDWIVGFRNIVALPNSYPYEWTWFQWYIYHDVLQLEEPTDN